jgi:hypothetical protein
MEEVWVGIARCRGLSLAPSVSCSQRVPCRHIDEDEVPLMNLEEEPPFECEGHGGAFASFAPHHPWTHQHVASPCLGGYKHDQEQVLKDLD